MLASEARTVGHKTEHTRGHIRKSVATRSTARTNQKDGGGGGGRRVLWRRSDLPRGKPRQQRQINQLQVRITLVSFTKFGLPKSDLVSSQ